MAPGWRRSTIRTAPSLVLFEANASPPRPSRDILVVEDDVATAETLSRTLKDEGHAFHVAVDSAEGIHRLRQGQYHLLLLDLLLPQKGGMRVLQTLRASPTLRPPVVVVLSDAYCRADVVRAIEAGADDYITKPFDLGDLALRVDVWLRRIGPATVSRQGLRIHSFGRFCVEREGQVRLREGGRARKASTLFKYLLTHQERTVPTREVLNLLWPNSPEDLAATDLRSLLHHLRRLLGFSSHSQSCLEHTSTTVTLHLESDDWWDVAEFIARLGEAAQWRRLGDTAKALAASAAALALYTGDYLEEDAYTDWARPCRRRLREDWLAALSTMARLHEERGEYEAQEASLRTVLRSDPYREHTYRALMEFLVRHGRSAEALVLYRQLTDLLRAEFDADADPQTQALARRIGKPVPPS